MDDKYTLENKDVKREDAGEWQAVVKNRLAEKSISALLDVIRKTCHLQNQKVPH